MSKKTLALIIFLFLVTCGLLYLALVTTPTNKKALIVPTPTPLSVNAHTILTLAPATASESSKTTQYTISVGIDTGGNMVNSVQMELAYDPQALVGVVVTPGSFFQQPSPLLNNINTVDGRISYALAEQINLPGKNGTGTLALVSFNIAPTFTGKTTQISFLPKTAVAADRILESVLKRATGYLLMVTPAATPTGALQTLPTGQPSNVITQPPAHY